MSGGGQESSCQSLSSSESEISTTEQMKEIKMRRKNKTMLEFLSICQISFEWMRFRLKKLVRMWNFASE
jgi:hypothetical protein